MTVYYCCWTAKVNKNNKERLNPEAQQVIRENAIVNRIQNEVDHANAFDLRNFRLRLEMEKEA
jgi:hypothetical protein